MFQSVVLGVDGSEAAVKAATVCDRLGFLKGARVAAVSALETDPLSRLGLNILSENERLRLRRAVEDQVLGPALAAIGAFGIRVTEHTISDETPPEALSQAAEEANADLVVVGRHGHGSLRDFVLGRVSGRLLRRTRRPVLVVPELTDEALSDLSTRRILVPLDFSEDSFRGLEFARKIALETSAEILLFHATPLSDFIPLGPLDAMQSVEASLLEAHAELVKSRQAQLSEQVEKLKASGIKARWVFSSEHVVNGLVAAVKEHAVDLVLLSSHGRSGVSKLWLGSVAEAVLKRCPVPVLVVPCRQAES